MRDETGIPASVISLSRTLTLMQLPFPPSALQTAATSGPGRLSATVSPGLWFPDAEVSSSP